MTTPSSPSRRGFLRGALAAGGALTVAGNWPRRAVAQTTDAARPGVPYGVQVGEVTEHIEGGVTAAHDQHPPAGVAVTMCTAHVWDAVDDVRREL